MKLDASEYEFILEYRRLNEQERNIIRRAVLHGETKLLIRPSDKAPDEFKQVRPPPKLR